MTSSLSNVTLAILAGGEGSRMGKPKGLLEIAGKPILAYLLDQIGWPGPTMLVTAPGREKPPGHELFSREVIDPVAGEGPLRGVLTALETTETSIVVIATVDMPEIRMEQLRWLVKKLTDEPDALGVMSRRAAKGRVEPFPAAFCKSAAESIRLRLEKGQNSVQTLASMGHVTTPICNWPESAWTNLNNRDDLTGWLAR